MAGQSRLRSAAPQLPALRGKGAGPSSRQRSAEVPKLPRSRSFTGRMEQPRRQTRRGEQAQVHSAFLSLSSLLPGQGVKPPLSVAPRIQICVCVCGVCVYSGFLRFAWSLLFFRRCRGEGLECVGSALPGMARAEMQRESQRGAAKGTGSGGGGRGAGPAGSAGAPAPLPQTDPPLPPHHSSLLRFHGAFVF